MSDRELASLVEAFVRHDDEALALHSQVVRHVNHVTRRYPDAYFELGQRTPEAVEGLADRVFAICAKVPKGRFPFSGRAPFPSFVEEDFPDGPIRYHSFYAKLSITREILRDDYAFNLRRDPTMRWRDELHRAVGKVLKQTCRAVSGKGSHARWEPKAPGLRVARAPTDVRDRMRPMREKPLDELVPMALELLGRPISHSRLSNLLADVIGVPAEHDVEQPPETSMEDVMAIRESVLQAWHELDSEEQALVAALARGDDYDTLIGQVPAFRNRVAVSRAVKRVGDRFVQRLVREEGKEGDSVNVPPKELMERVLAVLIPLLPELETPHGP